MPGNMSKGDAPTSRSASLTFTIDSILNLRQRDGGDRDAARRQGDSGCKGDFEAQYEEVWDVRRRHDSESDGTGKSAYLIMSVQSDVSKSLLHVCIVYRLVDA